MKDRIEKLANVLDAVKRRELYRKLDNQVEKGKKLSSVELASLQDQLSHETAQPVRPFLWRMIMRQDCTPNLSKFLENWLDTPSMPDRNRALRFLRECQPDNSAPLGQKFLTDSDPSVRYEAALCLLPSSTRQSLGTIIDAYTDLPVDLRDEAEMYVCEKGGEEELRHIQLNTTLRGSGTVYDNLVRTLQSKLARGG